MTKSNIVEKMESTVERFERVLKEMIQYTETISKTMSESEQIKQAKNTSDELDRLLNEIDVQSASHIREAQKVLRDIRWMKVKTRCQIIKAKSDLDRKIMSVYGPA